MAQSEAARAFALSSVKRYVAMAREGRPLAPNRRPGSKPKLDERARRLLAADMEERPFVTLSERRECLKVVAGVPVSDSTVCRELQRMECTRKKGA
jgi:transposase